MDTIFGSEGAALKDQERMREINHEIGLAALSGDVQESSDGIVVGIEKSAV
jgi:hypothetical protein